MKYMTYFVIGDNHFGDASVPNIIAEFSRGNI